MKITGACWLGGILVFVAPSFVEARPVDARRAERALELALQAELAGDAAGARDVLQRLVAHAETATEAVGRSLLMDWLEREPLRVPGFSPKASRRAVVRSWSSMESFGRRLQERAWQHFVGLRPNLTAALTPVRVRIDRAAGVSSEDLESALREAFQRVGLRFGDGALELGVDLDAADPEPAGRRMRVKAQLSFVLTTTVSDPAAVLRFSRSRSELRPSAEAARAFVLRRLSGDVAQSVAWAVRRRALTEAWSPEGGVGPSTF